MFLTGLPLYVLLTLPGSPPPGLPEAPAPRERIPPMSVTPIRGGYQLALNRPTAELLSEALQRVDEKQLSRSLQAIVEQRKAADPDDSLAATLELVTLVTSTQLPGFKKELAGKIGPGGVVITLTGLQKEQIRFRQPRPRLETALGVVRTVMPLLPDEAREVLEGLRAMARTTPLMWKVEPRP
jgi:hypothetical protein